jgi:hypothetical protein
MSAWPFPINDAADLFSIQGDPELSLARSAFHGARMNITDQGFPI